MKYAYNHYVAYFDSLHYVIHYADYLIVLTLFRNEQGSIGIVSMFSKCLYRSHRVYRWVWILANITRDKMSFYLLSRVGECVSVPARDARPCVALYLEWRAHLSRATRKTTDEIFRYETVAQTLLLKHFH